MKKSENKIAGYRLVGKEEKIKEGDVCGWAKKTPIDMKNWKDALAGEYNQAVYRPVASFVDFVG